MNEFEQLFKLAVKGSQKKKSKFSLTVGTVIAITGDTCTVDDYEDVRLNAIDDNLTSQFTVYPKLNSKVIIGRIEGEDDCFVVKCSEIEKVIIKIDDQVFEMMHGKFKIEKGAVSLKSILNNTYEKLKTSIITTPSGPGQFSPADVQAFDEYNNQVNELLQ
jgi:hypothetical protein